MRFPTNPQFAVLMAALGVTLAASVATVAGSPIPASRHQPIFERLRGRLERIDARGPSLTLAAAGRSVDVLLDDDTTIFVDGRTTDLGSLHVGQDLCATWEPGPDHPTAQWVEPCDK
jgi:hypothetical protein